MYVNNVGSPDEIREELDVGGKVSDGQESLSGPVMQFHRLRELKINGTVGGIDQKDSLSYISLSFQMKQGRKAGYTPAEIQAAVIKAIKPGNSLRSYLEGRVHLDHKAFLQLLRSHYKEKDSTTVFHEMTNCVQLSSESEIDFCLRVMSLGQKVVSLSTEEGC